jgi:hypothetical protein
MQSARIWFDAEAYPLDLNGLRDLLVSLGCVVQETEWRLGDEVVPQLAVKSPTPFLIQIDGNDWVQEEAEELAEAYADQMTGEQASFMRSCRVRLEVGDNEEVDVTGKGVTSWAGFTQFDPGSGKARKVLRALTVALGGVFEDNVNGVVWCPPRAGGQGREPQTTSGFLANLVRRLLGRRQ